MVEHRPPILGSFSATMTRYPSFASKAAAVKPPMPDPMTKISQNSLCFMAGLVFQIRAKGLVGAKINTFQTRHTFFAIYLGHSITGNGLIRACRNTK
jgi:hypothetical protein